MSKRSFRRLAVVAGAALAVGSMAPAMAIRIDDADVKAVGVAEVEANAIDVTDVIGDLHSTNVGLPTQLVFGSLHNLRTTVGYHVPVLAGDAVELAYDAIGCPVGTALDLDVAAAVLAGAGLNVGNGNIGLAAGALGVVAGAGDLVEDVQDCIGEIRGDVVETLVDTRAAVNSAAILATSTALGVVGTASAVPGTVVGIAAPLVFGTVNNLNVTAVAQLAAVVSVL